MDSVSNTEILNFIEKNRDSIEVAFQSNFTLFGIPGLSLTTSFKSKDVSLIAREIERVTGRDAVFIESVINSQISWLHDDASNRSNQVAADIEDFSDLVDDLESARNRAIFNEELDEMEEDLQEIDDDISNKEYREARRQLTKLEYFVNVRFDDIDERVVSTTDKDGTQRQITEALMLLGKIQPYTGTLSVSRTGQLNEATASFESAFSEFTKGNYEESSELLREVNNELNEIYLSL